MIEKRVMTLKNGEELVLRKANPEDAQPLIDFINAVAGETDNMTFGENEFGVSLEEERRMITHSLNNNNILFLMGEIKGELVSNLTFFGGKRKRVEHGGEFGISVTKKYWSLGIGQFMVQYMIDWAKDTKVIRKINLKVREDNPRAIRLYESMGFEVEGIIKRDFLIRDQFISSICMGLLIDS